MRMQNNVVLVTGAGQGIGRAIASRLASEGAYIIINDLYENDNTRETLREVQGAGSNGCIIAGDVSDPVICRDIIAEGFSWAGGIDVLVNNAGIERNAEFLDVTEKDFDAVMNVNLKGAFFMTQAFAQHFRNTKRKGRIINISSVHEELPFPHFTSYCISKGGMRMMMRNLSIELAPLGITINNVAPGAIETPINKSLLNNPQQLAELTHNIPAGRLGKPLDVANAVLWLASDEADYVTGSTVYIDGGLLWNYQEQ
ncbi:glucose 1-dehydrogenase [Salmonella enterica subsp. enterica serovar Typhimurium]|nr:MULTISPECIES: glucose 1-dehydrogenase [Enterobacteriaceae]EBD1155405.1 glucose 1-dehydrogenase [Salmonella enterica subsp. enterica serovar Uganda]EBI0198271.1 glucose 1-dehydrogenase [Salmonella enterica subsp. enterica serovar Liverpool]ECU6887980.1 glucose 1-dehydrogenase [Salmonella enterica subsp. enterica serovar Muenster]EDW7034225.1 glucose 1-dehydrogenase [Salmonella enterica subsp. enterica serovar 4,[5],12:i:-]EEJ2831179.1 glucose 1-dehydrogenase [Salmonella enterica subsp. enter